MSLKAALAYINLGWNPIPIYGLTAAKLCTCKDGPTCPSPGKHPRIQHWQNLPWSSKEDSVTHPGLERVTDTMVQQWWHQWPHANIGIQTGKNSGIFVIDIDPRSHGDDEFADLQAHYGPIPDTVEAISGSGGRH